MKLSRFRFHPLHGTPASADAADASADAADVPTRNRPFLAHFVSWYIARQQAHGVATALAVALGVGVATLFICFATVTGLFPTTRANVDSIAAAVFGTLLLAAGWRVHLAARDREAAALALAGALLDTNQECMKLLSLDGHMLRLSEYGATLMDLASPHDITGADWLGFWKGDDRTAADAALAGARDGRRTSFRGWCNTAAGRPKAWDCRLTPVFDARGRVLAVICASTDITSEADLEGQLRARNELLSEMEEHVRMVFYSCSANFEFFHHITAGAERVFGLDSSVFHRDPTAWLELVHQDDLAPLQAEMQRVAIEATEGRAQYRVHKPDGSTRWLRSTGYPVRDSDGAVLRIVGVTEDVTSEVEHLAALDRLAYTDSLTGLANRASLLREMEGRCASGEPFALMFVDLDRFKVLNDTLGHVAADRLLKGVGDVIRTALTGDAFVARLGGDEFAIVIGCTVDRAVLSRMAENLLSALLNSRLQDRTGAFMTASIGISLFPENGADHEALLSSADVAMYAAKKAGRNAFRFAGKEAADTIGDFELERDLPDALATDQFTLHYQTIHEPGSLTVHGVEALIRWNHPVRGFLLPGAFIPMLEETGLIAEVGVWVLDHALRQLAGWRAQGATDLSVAVNVSARQLGGDAIVREVDRALKQYGIPPSKLEIELTETALMQNPADAKQAIVALKRLGVRIAIDDFGTGYSSLKYLADFAPHTLKIDRHFTSRLGHDAAPTAIVEGIITLARKLGIKVVAEGVEEQMQLDVLRRAQCDYVQGYFLGRPQAPEQVERRWASDAGLPV
ncbi:putative bifunctional diguanylate cyclase/phosphodiesterase [Paraburkholderia phosphatilytica]|uniref:putative bifunctional diguanylate cyclase/phosphodiesterase n=1 Tax=Paraburkholderia phosphatilytica TaxID=2282883 RepID=UPI001F0C3A2D|nr:EAL domain-containing protein [Paraburkholderia phosphatilytica]